MDGPVTWNQPGLVSTVRQGGRTSRSLGLAALTELRPCQDCLGHSSVRGNKQALRLARREYGQTRASEHCSSEGNEGRKEAAYALPSEVANDLCSTTRTLNIWEEGISVFARCERHTRNTTDRQRDRCQSNTQYLPAMQAVVKQATLPAIMARKISPEMSERRSGAMPPRAPSINPMEERLENPHSAYVAITTDCS